MYAIARLAVIKFIRDTMAVLPPPPGIGLGYIDWDEAADIQTIPSTDLIGLNGFGMTDEDRQHEVVFGVTLASYNDPNLFRVTGYADHFYRALRAGAQFPAWDTQTAEKIGTISIYAGTVVSAVTRAENRVMQNIVTKGLLVLEA